VRAGVLCLCCAGALCGADLRTVLYLGEGAPPSSADIRVITGKLPARGVFPPAGLAYKENAESHTLWRWIAVQAPDLVLIAGEDFGLARALIGKIPARRVRPGEPLPDSIPKSEAHKEMDRRLARSPHQVAEELAQVYGHDFNEATYIPGIALIGRLRLGELRDVERIVASYVLGEKDSLANATGSHLAGHLVFGELAERTSGKRYVELVRKAAELGFTEAGEMLEAMPFHVEMSDAVFMGCPILAKAGKLTGERRYFAMALRHLEFMQRLCLRPDGIYRNSPLTDAAWGRGNAFPALGLALALSDMPSGDAAFAPMMRSFQNHIRALARYQDENGMWRQVIDYPAVYSEFSATAMIGTAMLRGIRNGWLDAKTYQPLVDKAWRAVSVRTGSDGVLIDVCEGTGKQKSLDDYLRRTAILGKDPRGGAMALLFATEFGLTKAGR
jgi:unsaturated rhamnogalacturonyl hydrolase